MGVKPFCINIGGMSDEQVKEIFKKSVDGGGNYYRRYWL